MRLIHLTAALLLGGSFCLAQSADDPVVMTIAGKPVLRSEFAYLYSKNNTGDVMEKKSVKDYVPLFVDYKLKVQAAMDARLDTLKSFQKEFAVYRDQQIRPTMIDSTDIEAAARRIYENSRRRIDDNGGLVRVAHIFVRMPQKASEKEQSACKERIDSLYNVLLKGGDFGELAKQYSQDPRSAVQGGDLGYIAKGQTFKEFEDQAFSLDTGKISRPFLSPAGWHIVKVEEKRKFFPYEQQRPIILKYIDRRGLRERIIAQKIDTLARQQHMSAEELLARKRLEMTAKDSNLKYLIQEYHDGLLLFEISNRQVWNMAQTDSVGQERYYKKHKKLYRWDEPRFKGIAYYTRTAGDIKAVKTSLKGVPFEEWTKILGSTFNTDSVVRIHVVKGIFKKGDDALVDSCIFDVDTVAGSVKDFPYHSVYGKKLKKPESVEDVRPQVIADYQEELEKQWVEQLRKRYPVEVNEQVLATVKEEK